MLEGLQSFITGIGEDVKTFVSAKPITSAVIGAGAVGTTTLGTLAIVRSRRKTKKKTKKRTAKGRSRDRIFKSKQKHEKKYKRKKKYKVYGRSGWIKPKTTAQRKANHKRRYGNTKIPKRRYAGGKKRVGKIYYTKNRQPYKILASGKARFIKKGGRK